MINMKILFVITILIFAVSPLYSQFSSRNIINENSGIVRIVRSGDFDQDGDMDVVTASFDLIAWYENIDGQGTFGNPIPIQKGKKQSFALFPADLDGDGMTDLIVSFFDDDEVVWYRNLGGGVFSALLPISADLVTARGINAADLDGDGDLDIVMGVTNGSGLYWSENLDGMGTFGSRITISPNISQARTQAVGDIDGDGDLDILTNSSGNYYLSWFENTDGLGTFTNQHIVDPVGLYTNFVYLFDLDGDEALDILSEKSDLVIWRKNSDGLGNFTNFMIIADETLNPSDAIGKDVDNDGDLDIVSSFSEGNTIAWYENTDGLGGFGPQIIIDPDLQSPRTVHTADLDDDGDLDVISAALSNEGRELVWYENLTILGIKENEHVPSILYYPNPVQEDLHIENNGAIIKEVEILNLQGTIVFTTSDISEKIDLSFLNGGLYLLKTSTDNGVMYHKIVKE